MPTTIEELEAAILFVNRNILKQYEDCERQVLFIIVIFVGLFQMPSIFTMTLQIEDLAKKNAMQTRRNLESV